MALRCRHAEVSHSAGALSVGYAVRLEKATHLPAMRSSLSGQLSIMQINEAAVQTAAAMAASCCLVHCPHLPGCLQG